MPPCGFFYPAATVKTRQPIGTFAGTAAARARYLKVSAGFTVVRALTFVLSDPLRRRCLGHALICVDRRYAAVAWLRAGRLEHRVVGPAEWSMFRLALCQSTAGPLPSAHIVRKILLSGTKRQSVSISLVAELPMEMGDGPSGRDQLDAFLRELAGPTPTG